MEAAYITSSEHSLNQNSGKREPKTVWNIVLKNKRNSNQRVYNKNIKSNTVTTINNIIAVPGNTHDASRTSGKTQHNPFPDNSVTHQHIVADTIPRSVYNLRRRDKPCQSYLSTAGRTSVSFT